MKKKLSIICSTVLCVFFVACSSQPTNNNTTNETVAQNNQTVQTTNSSNQKDSGTVGNYAVTIKSASIGKAYDGKTAVIITYDFTNNNTESISFMAAIGTRVYQNGVELDSTVVASDDENWMKNIQPGTTLEVKYAYVLQDTSNPIDVEVTEFFSLTNQKITKTFDLK